MNIFNHDSVHCLADALQVFPLDAADAQARADAVLIHVQLQKEKLLAIRPEERTFANTIRAFDEMERVFNIGAASLQLYAMLNHDLAHRDEPFNKVVAEETSIFMDVALYKAFCDYAAHNKPQETLNIEEEQYFANCCKDFEREGFKLAMSDPEKFTQLNNLRKKAIEKHVLFSRNCDGDESFITAKQEELSGLAEAFVAELPRDEHGACVVTCTMPNRIQILSYCTNASVRERFWLAWNRRGYPDNGKVLEDLLSLRRAIAQLLGFASYAEYELSDLMIGSEENAYSFIRSLRARASKKLEQEFAMLAHELPSSVALVDGKLRPCDFEHVVEMYKRKQGVDNEKIAEYFPIEHTKDTIFAIYEKFMDVSFTYHRKLPVDTEAHWYSHCEAIEIRSKNGKHLKGFIILDLFPRAGKYNHACHAGTIPGLRFFDEHSGEWRESASVGVVVANFPTSSGDKPPLLTHYDATTFFHEFGHAMHYVLGRSGFNRTTGTGVKIDFVEFPSQILEEWMWNEQLLCMKEPFQVSCHYATGEPLPHELVEKMLALKKSNSASFTFSQLAFSELALRYHGAAPVDLDVVLRECSEKPGLLWDDRNKMYAGFCHLGDYGSRYYGYMFSRAYAQDAFSQIKAHGEERGVNGLIDPVVGERFVSYILRPGGSIDPNILLHAYLGRAPSIEALCKDLGF